MRLYRKADGTIVGTQADAGKGYAQFDVPVDKAGLIAWLNEQPGIDDAYSEPAEELHTPAGLNPLPVPTSSYSKSYTSPLDARTVIAGIDAGMVSSAVRQFDSTNLAKVMTAGIERMSELARQLETVDLLS